MIGNKEEKVSNEELINAIIQENDGIRRQIYDLERRIGKFERIHETIFQQEAQERLRIRGGPESSAGLEMTPLRKLRQQ